MDEDFQRMTILTAQLAADCAYTLSQSGQMPPTMTTRCASTIRGIAEAMDQIVSDTAGHDTNALLPQNLLTQSNLMMRALGDRDDDADH